ADRAFTDCAAGEERPCTCSDGLSGTQRCTDAGAWPGCTCSATLGEPDAAAPNPVCGDGTCNGDENCRSCPDDCNVCPKCPVAPSCTDAVGVPSKPELRADLSQPPGTGGVTPETEGADLCRNPELRFRI